VGGVVEIPEGYATIQRDLYRLKTWANRRHIWGVAFQVQERHGYAGESPLKGNKCYRIRKG